MTEEIKEILDELKKYPYGAYYGLKQKQAYQIKQLLDYITNLQQQIEEYQKALDETMSEKMDLQQENEFLKLNNPEMNIEHFRIVKENKRKIDNLRKENERLNEDNLLIKSANKLVSDNLHNYKSRCKKAIEYINNNYDEVPHELYGLVCGDELLNILNGSDENE